jgi:hypothetical protein
VRKLSIASRSFADSCSLHLMSNCSPTLPLRCDPFGKGCLLTTTSFIPGGTTGFVQVCDTVVNRSLKNRIEELADQYIDKNEKEWVEGKYSVGQRRVLLTKWVGQAWEDMHAEDSDMIRLAFKQVGLGLPVDGSQDHEIKIKDFPEVQVGNWKDWQPIRGEGDKLESNLTPEEVEKLASEIIVDDDDDVLDMDGTIIVDVE